MAAPKTDTKIATPFDIDIDATTDRVRELNEKVLTAAKQTGEVTLDTYEQTVHTMLDFSQKAADATKVDWVLGTGEVAGVHHQRVHQHLHQGRSRPAEVRTSHVPEHRHFPRFEKTLFESRRNAGVRLHPPRND